MSISYTGGAFVPPGDYAVSLRVKTEDGAPPVSGGVTRLAVRADPRVPSVTTADLEAQHALTSRALRLLDRIHERIGALRDARSQIAAVETRARAAGLWSDALEEQAEALRKALNEVEETLIQTANESPQDPINFPPRLDNQVAYLYGHVARNYGAPTAGSAERLGDLEAEAAEALGRLNGLLGDGLRGFNEALAAAGVRGGVTTSTTH